MRTIDHAKALTWIKDVASRLPVDTPPVDDLDRLTPEAVERTVARWLWQWNGEDHQAIGWWPWCQFTHPEESCAGCPYHEKRNLYCGQIVTWAWWRETWEATKAQLVEALPSWKELCAEGARDGYGDQPRTRFLVFPRAWLDREPDLLLFHREGEPRCIERPSALLRVPDNVTHYAAWDAERPASFAFFAAGQGPEPPSELVRAWGKVHYLLLDEPTGWWVAYQSDD